jgi:probable LLM family oxidoreductase
LAEFDYIVTMIELGIDSFASNNIDSAVIKPVSNQQAMADLLERIQHADACGLDVFGVGEHHRKEFLDAAPSVILAAAASRTKNIRLTSAVAVLSAADPVRLFQQYATLDLISGGRAEMVVGRGSFSEAFPLFGLDFNDYDDIFTEKLDLLLNIRNEDVVTWQGKFRPALHEQPVYPRPVQDPLPIWVGVGGTPESAIRAGSRGLPLMIAIIGGETRRFKRLVDIYYQAGEDAGYSKDQLKVGIHSLGYLADDGDQARDEFFPGYAEVFTKIGKERGWSSVTRSHYDSQVDTYGALLVGSPAEVAEKIKRHSEALGGISRLTFQMNVAALPHDRLMRSIELIGAELRPQLT